MTTSPRILEYLAHSGSGTVAEIARALDLTKADIRYNLAPLLRNHQVMIAGTTQQVRGRPAARYTLCHHPSAANLEFLLNALSAFAAEHFSAEQIAAAIWQKELAKVPPEATPHTRINFSIAYLKELGVNASWSAGRRGPQVCVAINPYKNTDPQPYEAVVDQLIGLITRYACGES